MEERIQMSPNGTESRGQCLYNPRYLILLIYLIGFFGLLMTFHWFRSAFSQGLTTSLFWQNLIQFATFFALTFLLQRILLYCGWEVRRPWRYRLPFLASAGLGIGLWFFPQVSAGKWYHLTIMASTLGGALAGAFVVTAVDLGLAELNMPPSREVQEQVRQQHQEFFGEAIPEPLSKYYLDVFLAFLVLIVSAPIWMVIAFFIWWEDPGPIFFIKNSVGRCGINFLQLKFRSMIWNAERETGPVLAAKDDKRLLLIGKLLRKTALDELPQVINILRGEMSFVGPRPQRTILVNNYIKNLPQYALRHRVRPGLAGLAQVAGHYYVTPLQKLRYDRVYVRHIGLRFDLKILLCAFLIVFWFRWQKDWDGCLPAWLLEY